MRHLLVPGRGVPKPAHWMNRWAAANPDYRWAPPPGPPFVVADRVAALEAAVRSSAEPVLLIAHSAGCVVTALWALAHDTTPVHAALLATPPDRPDLPFTRLPFRSVVVSSSTDPYTTPARFAEIAAAWGADLVDAGAVGHLDTASGFGPWPAGEKLLRRLSNREDDGSA